MTNLLSDAALWRDSGAHTGGEKPPRGWDETSYTEGWGDIYGSFAITIDGYVQTAGDKVAGTIDVRNYDGEGPLTLALRALVNWNQTTLGEIEVDRDTPVDFSFLVPDGTSADMLVLELSPASYSGQVNVAPGVEAVDDYATTQAGQAVTVDVLANDLSGEAPVSPDDLAGPPAILAVLPEGAGTAVVNVDWSVTFTPAPGFSGEVEIPYQIEAKPPPAPQCAEASILGLYENAEVRFSTPPTWWAGAGEGASFYLQLEVNGEQTEVGCVKQGDIGGVVIFVIGSTELPPGQVVEGFVGSVVHDPQCAHVEYTPA